MDQVYPGQEAVLWFSAVPARATPEFEGHVVRAVAAHVVRDAESGPILVRGRAREQPTWPSPLYVASTVLPGEASLLWRPEKTCFYADHPLQGYGFKTRSHIRCVRNARVPTHWCSGPAPSSS